MRRISFLSATLCLAASVFGGSFPSTQLRGEYIEARTADVYTGPCFANSEAGLAGDLAVMGWKIDKGSWQGVNLDGLSVMGVVHASSTLGDISPAVYPVKAVLIIDESANAEQRLALKSFAQKMGGQLLADVVRVDYQPIQFAAQNGNIHSMSASMTAGGLAKLETRALTPGDQICHNESTYYPPLTKVDHAMAAYTVANDFNGEGLGSQWNMTGNRGSFLGTFHYQE